MSSSSFNLLTSGACFDRSRFSKDIDLFVVRLHSITPPLTPQKKEAPAKKGKGKGKSKEAAPSHTLPASLNFFGDNTGASTKAKPAPETDSGDDDSGDDSDAESSASSQADIPEPPKQKITVTGPDPLPASLTTDLDSLFSLSPSSPLRKPLLRALHDSNIHSLWGVQCAVGGSLIGGHDTMCVAPTGSGKTLSYLLPTIVALERPARKLAESGGGKGIRSLIVVPTHDLAIQIHGVLKAITSYERWRCMVLSKATEKAVCESAPGAGFSADEDEDMSGEDDESTGSVNEFAPKASGSGLGIDVLIATPERLHHLLDSKVSLAETRHIILDESDRLLSTDFLPQVEPIVDACTHPDVQKCLLSATMPSGAEELARRWLKDRGVRVVVGVKDSAVTTVDQSLLYTGSEAGKLMALRNLLAEGGLPYPSLVFVQSIERADELAKQLIMDGVRAEGVHSGRSKTKRDAAIASFRSGDVWVLVVTEVLARGMDFRGVKVVVNYDFPQTVQSYIHRIGRTGRAGRPGKAITFFSTEDGPYLRTIANVLRASGCDVPEYMFSMAKPTKNLKRQLAKAPVKRKAVGGGGRDLAKEAARKKRAMVEGSKRRRAKADKPESGEKPGKA